MNTPFDYEKHFMGVGNIEARRSGKVKVDRHEYRMYNFLRHISTLSGAVCDVGCGGGKFLEQVKQLHPNAQYFGCDISKTALALAKETTSGDIQYDLMQPNGIVPYQENTFDLCLSLDVLEHVEHIEDHIREIFRVLKPGGKFHACLPCEGEPFSMTWFYQKSRMGKNLTYKNWGHIHPELTHKLFFEYVTKAGFLIEKVTYSYHLPFGIMNFFAFFLPKELLRLLYGEKAYQFTDAGVIQKQIQPKAKRGIMDGVRALWMLVLKIVSLFQLLDTALFSKFAFSSTEIHITCRKQ